MQVMSFTNDNSVHSPSSSLSPGLSATIIEQPADHEGEVATRTTSLGDVLLKPDIFKWLVAFIDGDDVRGVSLLDCAISDMQYLRPLFLHMLGSGELICKGLEFPTYMYEWNMRGQYSGYMRWVIGRNITLRCVSLKLARRSGLDWQREGDLAREWIKLHCIEWEAVGVLSGDESVYELSRLLADEHRSLPRLKSIHLAASAIAVTFLAYCPNVESVTVDGYQGLDDVSLLGQCKQLKRVRITDCPNISDISPLGQCPLLESVTFLHCFAITDVSALGSCQQLRQLSVQGGSGRRVEGIGAISKTLEMLELRNVTSADLVAIGEFIDLRKLTLFCSGVDSISPLAQCKQLEYVRLSLGDGINITNLSALAHCVQLRTIALNSCKGITDISSLGSCAKLESIKLSHCPRIVDLSALAQCVELRTIELNYCRRITDVSLLGSYAKLKRLVIYECQAITHISSMNGCAELESITMSHCPLITDLSALVQCVQLRTVALYYCRGITDISFLGNCAKLESLRLGYCPDVTDLSALAHCDQLKTVTLNYSNNISDISFMGSCAKLESITLEECPNVTIPASANAVSTNNLLGQIIKVTRK
jgi:BspA type Leucine rich repeat region (6 copies)